MAKGVRNAKNTRQFHRKGYHQCPETTEIPGWWFLGQKTQILCGFGILMRGHRGFLLEVPSHAGMFSPRAANPT